MPPRSLDGYFPRPRDELLNRLKAGDNALRDAMDQKLQLFGKGDVLVKAEEDHRSVYQLMSGMAARVRILGDGRRQVIAICLPGDLLAVKAMLLDRQPDSVECLSPCTVAALSYTKAIEMAASNPNVAFRFMWQLAEDKRRLHNQVVMLGRGSAVERISAMLIDLTRGLSKFGVKDGEQRAICLRQHDIADYLGLTLVHVNRTLRKLRVQGAITVQRRGILITDREAVRRYAAPLLDTFEREAAELFDRRK